MTDDQAEGGLDLETGSMLTPEQQKQVLQNGRLLSDLLLNYLRTNVMGSASPSNWQRVAWGLLGRSRYTLETILGMPDRFVDKAVLTRTLFEHAVAFAWIAIEPAVNLTRWSAWTHGHQHRMFNHLVEVGAFVPNADEIRSSLQRDQVALGEAPPAPDLVSQARDADKHWGNQLADAPEFLRSYANLFRHYSIYVHPNGGGLMPFIPEPGADISTVGDPNLERVGDPAVDAVGVFAFQLMISAKAMGWPQEHEVLRRYVNGFKMPEKKA